MVEEQLRSRGITDERVLVAMGSVPRHLFVPVGYLPQAYNDHPLPIGHGQTISQPYIVAYMAEIASLKPSDTVLEVGTGCGYSAAILSLLAAKVYTSEIIPELGNAAAITLRNLQRDNVEVLVEDGSTGFKQYAPFDAIVVTAGSPHMPMALLSQLRLGGRLVAPVFLPSSGGEKLVRVTRLSDGEGMDHFRQEVLEDVRFVPLRGRAGWA
jgi:protein-L-isoaspartate(D-aspartate) O-methyltransferase